MKERLLEIYERLLGRYGPRHWWPADGLFEVIIGAILTQSATWKNASRAMDNLKERGLLDPAAMRDVPEEELAVLVRPSVYFNAKARKLKAFVDHLWEHYDGDLEALLRRDTLPLRQELLSIHGIGEETADDIVLYAAGRPIFVMDAYTRRILTRLGIAPARETYGAYQAIFMDSLPHDAPFFNEYHALLDRHASQTCRKRAPQCGVCCLLDLCPAGAEIVGQG